MKRALALALSALLLVSALPVLTPPASMITYAKSYVDKQSAYVGDTLTYTLSHYYAGSGSYSYNFYVYYSTPGGNQTFYEVKSSIDSATNTFQTVVSQPGYYYSNTFVYDLVQYNHAIAESPLTRVSLRPAPKITKVEAVSGTALKLAWTPVSGAAGYEVWRAASTSGPFTLVRRTTATGFTNTYLTPGKTYVYKVRTYNLRNNAIIASGAFSAAAIGVPLAKPAFTSLSGIGRDRVTLTWSKVAGATGYQVLRSGTAAGVYKLVKTLTGTSTTITGLTPGTVYYFKVQAYKKLYTTLYYSPLSAYKGMKTLR